MINKNNPKKFVFKSNEDNLMVLRLIHNNLTVIDTHATYKRFEKISVIILENSVKIEFPNGNSEVLLIKNINLLQLNQFDDIFPKTLISIRNGKIKKIAVQNFAKFEFPKLKNMGKTTINTYGGD